MENLVAESTRIYSVYKCVFSAATVTAKYAWVVGLAFVLLGSLSPRLRAQTQVFPQWIDRFDETHLADAPHAMAADALGNSYVTGSITAGSSANPDQEMMTAKYDADGHLLWKVFLSSPVHAAEGVDVAVDSTGNVFVLTLLWLGRSADGSLSEAEFATTKYNASGVRQWASFLRDPNPAINDVPTKLAVSAKGNIYVAGSSGTGNTTAYMAAKYSATGTLQWVRKGQSIANIADAATGIGADIQENLYIATLARDTTFNNPPFQSSTGQVIKYDANGTFLTTFSFGSQPHGGVSAFRVLSDGTSYVGTQPSGIDNNISPFIFVFDAAGKVRDLAFIFGICRPLAVPCSFDWADLVVDTSGNGYVAGTQTPNMFGNPLTSDIIIAKFDVNTAEFFQYVTRFNTSAAHSSADRVAALAANFVGELYLAGAGSQDVTAGRPTDVLTVKFSHAGNEIWRQRYHGAGAGSDTAVAMKIGGDGGLFVAGVSNGSGTGTDWAVIDYVQDAAKVSPATLSFANEVLGKQSASQCVTLTNTAEVDLIIKSIPVTGDFHLTNNCPSTLAPGASCKLGITFTPTELGARTGTLSVLDDWEGSEHNPQTVKLSGTGTP
jgi:hypothetical protein